MVRVAKGLMIAVVATMVAAPAFASGGYNIRPSISDRSGGYNIRPSISDHVWHLQKKVVPGG